MMIKKAATLFLLGCAFLCFGQQNPEFKEVKDYFDYQRLILKNEFKKRFNSETSTVGKLEIKKDFEEFMIKLDSIQNSNLVYALVKVKIREDLQRIDTLAGKAPMALNPVKKDLTADALYPGGFGVLREQVVDRFYTAALLSEGRILKTSLFFIVETDGSISSVHAEGDSYSFNRQAEIALYLLPDKFSPAFVKGQAVRYRFRLPLSINFD